MNVDQLAAQVAQLTQQLAALQAQVAAGVETLVPNYLSADARGNISADFSGTVKASELDLVAGTGASPIRWIRQSDGAVVASLTSDGSGNLSFSPGVLKAPTISGGEIDGTTIKGATVTASSEIDASTIRDQPTAPNFQLDSANGLRLAAGSAGIKQIRWYATDATDGAQVGGLQAVVQTGGGNSITLYAGTGAANVAQVNITDTQVTAGGYLIGDQNGLSNFVRGATEYAAEKAQQSISYSVPAGGTSSGTASFPGLLAANGTYQIEGYLAGNNALWAVSSYSDPTLTVQFFNPGSVAANGKLWLTARVGV